jgi:uncharacterized DUF497 family protein
MRFDWDPAKNRRNIRDHGIDFTDAVEVFGGASWERLDDRRNYDEERWVVIGLVHGIEITVVYTDQRVEDEVVRWIISARRATRDEREAFHRGETR